MVKLITFDVTGTLLRVKHSVGAQYADVLQKFAGISCNPGKIEKSFLKAFKNHSEVYPLFGRDIGLSSKAWWRSVFNEALIQSGTFPSSQSIALCKHSKNLVSLDRCNEFQTSAVDNAFEYLYNDFKYETVPHALELLQFLNKEKNYVVGIITNSDDRVHDILRTAGLIEYVDFVITSSICGCEKPDKKIFNCALKTASKKSKVDASISSSSALHIGDSLKEDYHGAVKAGLASLLLDPEGVNSKVINPKHCIKDLGDVFRELEKV